MQNAPRNHFAGQERLPIAWIAAAFANYCFCSESVVAEACGVTVSVFPETQYA
jgi:hypothetical protein